MIDWWHGLWSAQLNLDLKQILAIGIGVALVVVIWRFVAAWLKRPDPDPAEVKANQTALWVRWSKIPRELHDLHNAWLRKANRWEFIFYALTISSVLLAAIVAAISGDTSTPPLLDPIWIKIVAIASAVSTGLLAALNPYKNHEEFISAWRIVNTAKLEYLSGRIDTPGYIAEQVRIAEDFLKESRRFRPPEPGPTDQQRQDEQRQREVQRQKELEEKQQREAQQQKELEEERQRGKANSTSKKDDPTKS